MLLDGFLYFSQKVLELPSRPKLLAATYNLRIEQTLEHMARFLHFIQNVVFMTLNTEAFSSNVQFMYRANFSAFG